MNERIAIHLVWAGTAITVAGFITYAWVASSPTATRSAEMISVFLALTGPTTGLFGLMLSRRRDGNGNGHH